MTLNWQPSDSGERAEANGFEYICTDNSDEPAIFGELIIKFNGTQLSQDHFDQQQNAGYRKQKRTAQAHADTVASIVEHVSRTKARALSSKASTIDVEACAKDIYENVIMGEYGGENDATTAFIAEIKVAILRHFQPKSQPHSDDIAVDKFCAVMKLKLRRKRDEGYTGWDDPSACTIEKLYSLLASHALKGDVIDISNFCMMIFNRGYTSSDLGESIRKRLQPASESADKDKLLELAWGIIANANSGDWKKADSMWEEAAVRWRDAYHKTLPQPPAKESK